MTAIPSRMKWQEDGVENPLYSTPLLFDAALDAFSRQSFGEASLNDIIKSAGLHKGSFYYRFHDKTDLYLSLLYRTGMEKLELFRQYEHQGATDDFFDSFREKALLGLRLARKEPRYGALWRKVLMEGTVVRGAIEDCFGGLRQDVISDMIDAGKAKGQLRADIPTAMAASVISTLLDQIDVVIAPGEDNAASLSGLDELLGLLRHGMQNT